HLGRVVDEPDLADRTTELAGARDDDVEAVKRNPRRYESAGIGTSPERGRRENPVRRDGRARADDWFYVDVEPDAARSDGHTRGNGRRVDGELDTFQGDHTTVDSAPEDPVVRL